MYEGGGSSGSIIAGSESGGLSGADGFCFPLLLSLLLSFVLSLVLTCDLVGGGGIRGGCIGKSRIIKGRS